MERYYTDLEDFQKGITKLNQNYKKHGNDYNMMPILINVNDVVAPFGIATQEKINGVECIVLRGYSDSMKNITVENRKNQIKGKK